MMRNFHWSDCAVYREPAYRNGPCDCGLELIVQRKYLSLCLLALRREVLGRRTQVRSVLMLLFLPNQTVANWYGPHRKWWMGLFGKRMRKKMQLNEQDVRVINQAILAMLANNNCLITDLPEQGFQAGTSWTTNFTQEIKLLQGLIVKYGSHTVTGNEYANSDSVVVRPVCNGLECEYCNNHP